MLSKPWIAVSVKTAINASVAVCHVAPPQPAPSRRVLCPTPRRGTGSELHFHRRDLERSPTCFNIRRTRRPNNNTTSARPVGLMRSPGARSLVRVCWHGGSVMNRNTMSRRTAGTFEDGPIARRSSHIPRIRGPSAVSPTPQNSNVGRVDHSLRWFPFDAASLR